MRQQESGVTVCFTGLSGAGKTTICQFVEKGYIKARSGEIKHFTGINDPYEIPLRPKVECKTNQESVAESATKVLQKLEELGYIVANVNEL
jgi:adenylylsulfate kinase-like enzyme